MYSLRKIVKNAKQFSEDHKQIASFHYGFFDDVLKNKDVLFPIMVMTPQPKPVDELTDTFNFSVLIADLVHDVPSELGQGNELNVHNSTELISKDVIEYFNNKYPGLELRLPANLDPFGHQTKDHLYAGWAINISMAQANEHDYCAIPIDDEDLPSTQRYATVIDQNGDVVTALLPNQIYSVVIASGIDEGGATTTYSIQVVDI